MKHIISVRRAPQPVRAEIQLEDTVEEGSWNYEPFEVLQRKIEALMEITGGTEQECERMILDML